MIEHLVGMQAQSPQAPYVGIWTRATSFRRPTLERLLVRGDVVRATMIRATLHLVTRRDYGLIRAAMSESDFPWERAAAKEVAPAIRALAADGGVTAAEAFEHLERELGLTGIEAQRAWQYGRVAGHVVRHHEDALWTGSPSGRFVTVAEPEAHDPNDARADLIRRYLAAFGPASRRDLVAWTRNVPELQASLDGLELRRFRDEQGRELLDVPRAPLPDPSTPAPVRFLPKWDNVLLSFADRERVLPEPYRKAVIKQNGDVAQTFLVDGFVAGTWRFEDGRVVTQPFAPLPAAARDDVAGEAGRLEAFLAG